MTYQVLARKWRPRSFEQLVGQAPVTQALTHALTKQRLHHAYLFSGTRGVGKTTIARILAKCLNCEGGMSATPCGQCAACTEIDAGRFADLIEVDAASRTKVEDTRELLDNVVYAPTKGRYKIYLIDEVHMLSGHSFNALLKTLEEPPPHVLFLLATTDPERMPATVLSRCLQFHLRPISHTLLVSHLQSICEAEKAEYEQEALSLLAQRAQGSLRDALSLLEQAIGVGQGKVDKSSVELMLGCSFQSLLPKLLKAIKDKNTKDAMVQVQALYEAGADFSAVLDAILSAFHAWAICRAVPEQEGTMSEFASLSLESIQLYQDQKPEQIQLFYQIALKGKQDFPLSPNPKAGFEMTILRLIHFRPFEGTAQAVVHHEAPQAVKTAPVPPKAPEVSKAPVSCSPAKPIVSENTQNSNWTKLVAQLKLTGLARVLIQNCVVEQWALPKIGLVLDARQAVCLNEDRRGKIEEALIQALGKPVQLKIRAGDVKNQSPQRLTETKQQESLNKAQQLLQKDSNAQQLIKTFDATVEHVSLTEEKE